MGPTATGKSDLAVTLARRYNGEVISADSRQVYRGMDLGTGKITKKEMRGVPHHLLDVADPKSVFNVAKYKIQAQKIIADILKRKKLPIICGGTGFYIDAVVNDIILPDVKPDQKLRNKLEKKACEELFKILKKLDPARARNIDSKNKVRLVRAIEIARSLGAVPKIKSRQVYDPLFIGLDCPDLALQERIRARLKRRLQAGLVAEVARIHRNGVSYRRLEKFGLEYRNTALLLQKKISKDQLIQNLEKEIWQYAKRQRTWFRKNTKARPWVISKPSLGIQNIHWLNPLQKSAVAHASGLVKKFLLC